MTNRTEPYIVTVQKVPTEERDLFRSLPEEMQDTYREVHPGEVGQQVSYSIDLTDEEAGRLWDAQNLISLLRISDFGLGAFPHHDSSGEDHSASVALQDSPAGVAPRNNKYWSRGPTLNQGSEGACTGFSARHFLNADLIMTPPESGLSARRIYLEAKKVDEWAGEDYDGSSVKAACTILRSYGYIDQFYWAQSIEEIRDWLLYRGGIIFTLDWYDGCYHPDKNNWIRPTGHRRGIHAIFARAIYSGYPGVVDQVLVQNSWGSWYGVNGEAWLSRDNLLNVFMQSDNFAAACPVQVR